MKSSRIIGSATALVLFLFGACGAMALDASAPTDPDEVELLKYFEKVDVWHVPVDTTVRYNDQDSVVTREAIFQPQPAGRLCFIRFDVLRAEGEYGYGLKPQGAPGGPRNPARWGVNVLKRGTVLDQYFSTVRLNAIHFLVEGPRSPEAEGVCARRQAAPTPEAGNAYRGPWSDLVTKVRGVHGWPAPARR